MTNKENNDPVDPKRFRKEMGIPEPKRDPEERPWYMPTTARVQSLVIGAVWTTTLYALVSPELAWKLRVLLPL